MAHTKTPVCAIAMRSVAPFMQEALSLRGWLKFGVNVILKQKIIIAAILKFTPPHELLVMLTPCSLLPPLKALL